MKIFKKTDNKKEISSVNWQTVFDTVDNMINSQKNILIVVDKELDLESLSVLQKLSNFNKKIKIRVLEKSSFENSFTGDYLSNKILDIKTSSKFCFLLSSNLRLESAILNTKIRAKYLDQDFTIFGNGYNFKSNFQVQFVNLSLSNLLRVFEGKVTHLSKAFLTKSPIILIGESLSRRVTNINSLLSFIKKKIMPSAILLNIKEACNSSGVELLNIKALDRKATLEADAFFLINLNDNILVRTFLSESLDKDILWFNTHGSQVANKATYLIPSTTSFETESVFLNLESRPQRQLKVLSEVGQMRSIKNIFNGVKETYVSSGFLSYIYEQIENTRCFSAIRGNLFNKTSYDFNQVSQVSLYPIKPSIEDFYVKNKFCKNSLTMLQCSKQNRDESSNF